MNKVFLSFLFVNLLRFQLKSQTVEPSSTIEKNKFQTELETGFLHLEENNSTLQSWAPGTLFRFGVSNLVELQLGFQLIHEKLLEYERPIVSEYTFQKPEIGLAVYLWEGTVLLPEATFMTRIGVSYDKPMSFSELESIFALNLSNQISGNLIFNYNIGITYTGRNFDSVCLISNLSYEPVSKFHFFIENVSDCNSQSDLSYSLAAGGGYSFSNSFILDLSAGKSLTDSTFFAGAILTWYNQF